MIPCVSHIASSAVKTLLHDTHAAIRTLDNAIGQDNDPEQKRVS